MDDTAWPFTGRAEELTRFRRLVTDRSCRGVVLAGPAGVGKTRTALEGLAIVSGKGWSTARAAGHQAAARLPFGALAHLLPATAPGAEAMAQDRSELHRRFASALADLGGGDRLVLFVDDAHLLDDQSATLLYQVAVTNAAFVLVTVRAQESAPDPVVALWKDGLLERMELAGLPLDMTGGLVAAALNGPVDPDTTMTLANRCDGNVLFLRELVLGAREDGTLSFDNGMWRLVRPLHPSSRLVEIVEARLAGLTGEERELLELVSFAEPLGQAELDTLGNRDLAESLERRGLLSVRINHRRLEVRLAHPVYGDVLRVGLPVLRVREMARALAEIIEGTGARRREDILRIGGWRLVGGGGSPQLMLAAAASARWHYDFPFAERLVTGAQELGAGFDADLLAATLASIQGLSVKAEDALSAMAGSAQDDEKRRRITIARMENFLRANRSEDSMRVATEALEAITDQRWRDEITARGSTTLVERAGPIKTFEAVEPLLTGSGTTPTATVWACLTGARSLARLGRIDEAVELTVRGHAAHEALPEPIEWYPWFHLFNRCEALLAGGRLYEAETLAEQEHERGLTDHSSEAQACFALQLAKIYIARGRVVTAASSAREALSIFRRLGRPMFLHESLHTLALASALADRADEAVRLLAEIDALDLEPLSYDAADLLRARAWCAVAEGHVPRACGFLEESARSAEASGDLVVAVAALHDLARLGRARDVVGDLERLSGLIGPGAGDRQLSHVKALVAGDPKALDEVSASFAAAGANLLAADAAADAAVGWKRQGNPRAATAASQQAVTLGDTCEGASTPALRSIDARARLTPAERETAGLAAAGHTNKFIAQELGLSVRSIENRLQHVYHKLGISSRDELSGALNLSSPDGGGVI